MSDLNFVQRIEEEPDWGPESWARVEPPDVPDVLPDLGSPPDDFFSSELDLSWHEPPDDFLPSPHVVNMSQDALAVPFGFIPGEGPELSEEPDLDRKSVV